MASVYADGQRVPVEDSGLLGFHEDLDGLWYGVGAPVLGV
jgi:hypothetical protein